MSTCLIQCVHILNLNSIILHLKCYYYLQSIDENEYNNEEGYNEEDYNEEDYNEQDYNEQD